MSITYLAYRLVVLKFESVYSQINRDININRQIKMNVIYRKQIKMNVIYRNHLRNTFEMQIPGTHSKVCFNRSEMRPKNMHFDKLFG